MKKLIQLVRNLLANMSFAMLLLTLEPKARISGSKSKVSPQEIQAFIKVLDKSIIEVNEESDYVAFLEENSSFKG